jgi:MioC protein
MGSAEYVADQVAAELTQQGLECELHEQPEFANLNPQQEIWIICTSTHGAGEYPDNFQSFVNDVTDHESLNELAYGVIGLGDSSYDRFNQAAKDIDALLAAKGAIKLADRIEIDAQDADLPEDTVLSLLPSWYKKLKEIA